MSSLIKLTRTIEQFTIIYVLCMYTNMYLLCMIKVRIRWCTCRVENILTLGKLLSLWFCFLLHSFLFLISQTSYRPYKIISSYELIRPVMGTIFLVSPSVGENPVIQCSPCYLVSRGQTVYARLTVWANSVHKFVLCIQQKKIIACA